MIAILAEGSLRSLVLSALLLALTLLIYFRIKTISLRQQELRKWMEDLQKLNVGDQVTLPNGGTAKIVRITDRMVILENEEAHIRMMVRRFDFRNKE